MAAASSLFIMCPLAKQCNWQDGTVWEMPKTRLVSPHAWSGQGVSRPGCLVGECSGLRTDNSHTYVLSGLDHEYDKAAKV